MKFVDCTSLNISFDLYGFFTATFSIYSTANEVQSQTSVGGLVGYVADVTWTPLLNLPGWYVSTVTLIGET